MDLSNIDAFEIVWAAILSGGVGHIYLWIRSLTNDRKEQADKIHAMETEIAVLQSRETSDYNRLSGIEARLKALETCQGGMKADLAAIRALLEARNGRKPVAGSK